MRKSVWLLALVVLGIGAMLLLGLIGTSFLFQIPGVGENVELKDRIVTLYQPAEAVVAIDRGAGQDVLAIEVRLVYEDPTWETERELEDLALDVGRFAWRNYPSTRDRPLERVTVAISIVEGFGCGGPRELARREIPNPRGEPAGR